MSNHHQEDTQVLLPDLIIRQSNRDRDGRDLSRVRGVGRVLGRREEGSVGFRLVNECFSTCLMQEGEIQKEKREREREREREMQRSQVMISSTHYLLLVPSQLTEIVERNESTRRGTTASMRDRITAFPSPPSLLPPPSLVLFYQPSAWNCKSSNKVYSQSPISALSPTDPNQDVRTHLRTKWPIIVDISDDDPML
jgi:hypothetical protein